MHMNNIATWIFTLGATKAIVGDRKVKRVFLKCKLLNSKLEFLNFSGRWDNISSRLKKSNLKAIES